MNSKKKSISEQSKISMIGNLKIAIRAFQAIDQEIEFTSNFEKFVNEALKSKKEWISQHDIFYIFYDAIASRKNETAITLNEDVSAIDFSEEKYNLTESQIDFACKEIILKIESIPKEYNVKFPLPQVKMDEDIFLTKDISIVAARKFKDSLFEVNSPTFINIKTYGYITNSRDQSSMKDATSKLKQIIQIAVAKNVLKKGMNMTPHNFFNSSQSILKAIINEEVDGRNIIGQAPLTLGMSEYLSSLQVTSIFESSHTLVGKMMDTIKLMHCSSSQENSLALKSALEWSFDAAADDDETMRFIKTCIGLEAVLGEASEQGGITERLADRCAYLLRKTVTQRKDTRSAIRDIYRLRSKLVHGAVTKLSQSDVRLAQLGNEYLASVISAELRSLEDWWKKSNKIGQH